MFKKILSAKTNIFQLAVFVLLTGAATYAALLWVGVFVVWAMVGDGPSNYPNWVLQVVWMTVPLVLPGSVLFFVAMAAYKKQNYTRLKSIIAAAAAMLVVGGVVTFIIL